MPSGKKSRQQRQQAVPMPPRSRVPGGTPGARQASPRVLGIAGGAIVVVIVAVVLAIVLSGGSTNADGSTISVVAGTPALGNPGSPDALPDAHYVSTLLKGIPQHGYVLGQPTAPVTLVDYIDMQCPYCAEFETTELPNLIKKYVRTGQLKIEMNVWDIIDGNDGGDDSLRGQKAVFGAAMQNKAFDFAEVLYENQLTEGTGWLNDGEISHIAASVDGLQTAQLVTDGNSAAATSKIQQIDAYAGSQTGFAGTPVILLAKGSGKPKLYGTGWGQAPMDGPDLEAAISALLK